MPEDTVEEKRTRDRNEIFIRGTRRRQTQHIANIPPASINVWFESPELSILFKRQERTTMD